MGMKGRDIIVIGASAGGLEALDSTGLTSQSIANRHPFRNLHRSAHGS
jgi:hypothetical protein